MPDNRRNFFSLFGGGHDDNHEKTDTNEEAGNSNQSVEDAENDFLNGSSSNNSFASEDNYDNFSGNLSDSTGNDSDFDLNSFLNNSSNRPTFEDDGAQNDKTSSEQDDAFEIDEPDEPNNDQYSETSASEDSDEVLDNSESATDDEVSNDEEGDQNEVTSVDDDEEKVPDSESEDPSSENENAEQSEATETAENDLETNTEEDSNEAVVSTENGEVPENSVIADPKEMADALSDDLKEKVTTMNLSKPVEEVSIGSYIPKLIKISDIDQSDEHNYNRTMDDVDISILARSIKYAGRLLDPLTVYEGNDGKYHLISGNKRLAAWIKLNNEDDTWNKPEIPCFVIDKPTDEVQEGRLQMNANIGRKSDVDMQNEVRIAKDIWENKMSEDERKEMVPDLKAEFIDIVKDNKKYQKDPKGYLRNSFRPAVMFAWVNTGEAGSYASVRKTMRDIANDTYELDKAVEPDILSWNTSKPKKEVNPEDKLKASANKLAKEISSYFDDKPATDEAVALLDALEAFSKALG